MRERLWRKRVRLLLRYAPPGRLLDIGTGDGHFLGVAAAAGFQVHATEMSQRGIELCVQRGFEVFHGRPEDAEWGARQFDVVTLWHVLEHVPDPARLLGLAARLLSPGGLLAVAVPNEDAQLVPHRLRWRDKGHPLGVLAWGEEVHLTHFQPSTLRRALRGAGLRIVSTGVDDVYVRRSIGDLASLYLNKTVCMLTGGGWHGARAMFCLATKPVPGAAAR
jgi:SAM-dependent methyltransferase